MAITFSIDNDRILTGNQQLTLDETALLQTTLDTNGAPNDVDDDVGATYNSGTNAFASAALDAAFVTFISGLFPTDPARDAALGYVASVGAASSSDTFLQVTANAGETVENLFFSINPANPTGLIPGMKTLAGEDLFFHIDTNTDFATLTTSAGAGGRIVAAFYLDEDDDGVGVDHLTAQVQMATFEPIKHTNVADPDDALSFSDVLQVSVAASTNFTFDNLPSGENLYAAFGGTNTALLITGDDLNVNHNPNSSKFGQKINGGGDPSDSVNTSQAAPGAQATIGINSQHFTAGGQGQNLTDGTTANFTFVTGFVPLQNVQAGFPVVGDNVQDIDYSNFINTTGAGIDISQLTGGSPHADLRISLWEAGGGTTPEEGFSYIDSSFTNESEIGDDTALHNDAPIILGQVKVTHNGVVLTFNGDGTQSGITVDFVNSNTFTVTGLGSFDSVDWTAAGGDTFNRVKIQALASTNPFDLGGVHINQGSTTSVGIGSHLFVDDDGPSVTAPGEQPVLVVDDTTLGTNATASFAGVFTPVFGTDGAATGGGVGYTLGAIAGPSGIVDVATNEAVNLSMNAGVVEGRTASTNLLVFTVSVAANGDVTLDQVRAVKHNDPLDPDEPGASAATLSADNLVTLTATVTDKDGDTNTAVADIGLNLQFKDDGPSVTAPGEQPVLVVDDTTLGTNATASFAGVFTPVFGADGAAAGGGVGYTLGAIAGPSGIVDVATNEAVNLSMNAGVVEGRTASTNLLVFTVSVAANGDVTLDQVRAVKHNDPLDPDEPGASAATLSADNLVTLTATVTDKDGDTNTAVADIGLNLQFKDDGPSVTAPGEQPVLVVDDTTLGTNATASFAGVFTPVFGADGAATGGGVGYTLGAIAGPSGIVDVATNEAVNLSMNAGVVEGRTASTNLLVFTVSVAANGDVTLDQVRAVKHNDPLDPDEPGASAATLSADNLVTLTATVTDKDGDTNTAVADIGLNLQFKDDGPTVLGAIVTDTVDDDGGNTGNPGGTGDVDAPKVETGTVTGIFNGGADGLKSFDMSIDTSSLSQTLHSQGGLIKYDVTNDLLTAYVEDGTTAGYQLAEDREVFTFALDGSTGAYTFTLIDQIDHPTTTTEDNLDIQLGILLQVTDGDDDQSANAALTQLVITVNDDSPVVNTADADNDTSASNDVITTTGASGAFDYAIGFDDREGTVYSSTNTDLLVTFIGGTVGEGLSANPITAMDIDWFSEDEHDAEFHFSFTYVSNPADNTTTNDSGVLTFDKDAGTYTFTLTDPISSFGILSLANASGFTGYIPNSATTDQSQPEVTVAALADDFFVQFTGAHEPGGGTDGNNAAQQALIGNNNNLDALAPGEAWSNVDDDNFADGEVFTQERTWVSVSGEAAGTAGDTMQAGEVLDFNFFAANPEGFLSPAVAKATTSTMFIEFDALDNGEDLVVVLKLVDQDNPATTTTRAVIVDYDDIFHIAQQGQIPPGFFVPGSIDQNDGLVIIDRYDYNFGTENWTIAGAQVVASTEGLSGSGIDLSRAIGAAGGSSLGGANGTFTTPKDSGGNNGGTWDGDVFKIVNIGFLTDITPDSQFNFDVQVVDFDGDTSPLQHFTIDVLGQPLV